MLVPISWLKKYVPVKDTPDELAHKLTMAGVEIGDVDVIGGDWEPDKIVVGHVLEVNPHPNADRLRLPTVDIGEETVTVVCGAPNLAAGQKIAFAKEGARMFSPRSGKVETLKRARIRGVESAGMVCASLELGIGEDYDGIMVLDADAPVGTPLGEYLGDAILDAEVSSNRPDCLSILGIAHEVAAINGEVVTEPDSSYPEEGDEIENLVKNRDRRPRPVLSVHGEPGYRSEDRAVAIMDAGRAYQSGPASYQQRGGHYELRDAGVRSAAPRIRLRQVQRQYDHRQGGA